MAKKKKSLISFFTAARMIYGNVMECVNGQQWNHLVCCDAQVVEITNAIE